MLFAKIPTKQHFKWSRDQWLGLGWAGLLVNSCISWHLVFCFLSWTVAGRDENGATQEATLEEPKNKKVKKDKKEKKDKKAKKEKKDKKEKAKQKMSFASPSGSSHSDASLQGRRSLEDDLRKKALLSVRRD